jgi:hypothetical protein
MRREKFKYQVSSMVVYNSCTLRQQEAHGDHMRALIAVFVLLTPSFAAAQSCAVTFETATVKPSVLDSLITVLKSFNSKGEAQRLTNLRQEVLDLRQDKQQLADTLGTVAQQNSVPDWLQARIRQIPGIQSKVLDLLKEMRAEADQGGLFAGDQSFADLTLLIDQKQRDMSQLCLLSQQTLPLNPVNRGRLESTVTDLKKELDALDKIDQELQKLIQKAHDSEKSTEKPKSGAG